MRSPSHLLVDRLQKVSVQNTMLGDRSLFIIVRDFKSLIKISLKYFFICGKPGHIKPGPAISVLRENAVFNFNVQLSTLLLWNIKCLMFMALISSFNFSSCLRAISCQWSQKIEMNISEKAFTIWLIISKI